MKSLVEEFRDFQVIEGFPFRRGAGSVAAPPSTSGLNIDVLGNLKPDIPDVKNVTIDAKNTDVGASYAPTTVVGDPKKTDGVARDATTADASDATTADAKKADSEPDTENLEADPDTGNSEADPEPDTGNPEADKKLKEENDELKQDIENKNKEIEELETKKKNELDPEKKKEIELEIKKKEEELKRLKNKNKLHNRAIRKMKKYKGLIAGAIVLGVGGWFLGTAINSMETNEADVEKEAEITKIENCIKNYFKNINNNEDNEDNKDNEECEKLILQDKQNDFFNKKLNENACPKRPNRPLNVMEVQNVREQYDKDTIHYVECLEKILRDNNIACDYDPEIAKDEIYIGDLTSDPFYSVIINGQKLWDFFFKDLDKKIIVLAILVIGLVMIKYGNRIIKFIGLVLLGIGTYLLIDLDNLDKLNRLFEKTKCDLSE